MPANNDAIYTKVGDQSNNGTTGMNQPVLTAANDYTGAGANNSLVFTADATNGGFVRGIYCKAAGTNVQTVARVFLNNGLANTTAANNSFITEATLPATTASANSATSEIYIPINRPLMPASRIYVGLGTAVAAGWVFHADAGKY